MFIRPSPRVIASDAGSDPSPLGTYPSFWEAILLSALALLIAVVTAAFLGFFQLAAYVCESIGLLVGTGTVLWLVVRAEKGRWAPSVSRRALAPAPAPRPSRRILAERLFVRPMPVLGLVVIPATTVGLLLLQGLLDAMLVSLWPVPDWFESLYIEMFEGPPAVVLSRVALEAPLTEELLVRGVFLSAFARRYGARRAIVLSSTVFALIHANPWQAVPAFFSGILFAWWTLRSGSILPALLAHAVGNGLIAAATLWPDVLWEADLLGPERMWPSPLDVALGVGLLVAGVAASRRLFRAETRYHDEPAGGEDGAGQVRGEV